MQPDLDRHRVRKQTCGTQPARYQAGITKQDRRKLISGDKISFEGVFDGDRLGLPIRLSTAWRSTQQAMRTERANQAESRGSINQFARAWRPEAASMRPTNSP